MNNPVRKVHYIEQGEPSDMTTFESRPSTRRLTANSLFS